MARMIPAQIYSGNPSFGEKEIFRRLKNDAETGDWIVLHSLDIADHVKNVAGEADFVIIVPHKGILCLEVKGTSQVRRANGLWYYGHDTKPDYRGPFKQASQAMHSIRKHLISQTTGLSKVVFWSAVIFPYSEFDIVSGEWHQWQMIDTHQFRSKSIGKIIIDVLDSARSHLLAKNTPWFKPSNSLPDKGQCENILNALRPDFEIYEPPQSRFTRLAQEVKRFTQEQFVALDAMDQNDRVIFKGPAGTGKTILAIESARRSESSNKNILVICYNRLLSYVLQNELKPLKNNVKVCTLHKHMLDIVEMHPDNSMDLDASFWNDELPSKAIDALLLSTDEKHLYDEIILDEAQDLLRNSYLDFLDLSLKGGLNAGRWRMFGDFEKQAIYRSNADINLDDAISSRLSNAPIYNLRINCRNTPRIASFVHLLGALNPEYQRILRPDDGSEPTITYYASQEEQDQKFLETIKKLKNEGFGNKDIVVLSTKSTTDSTAQNVKNHKSKFSDLAQISNQTIRSGTIHSFKGLESPAVIVTDVEFINGDHATSLFYVATTRALHRLHILASVAVKQQVIDRTLNT